MSGQRASSGAQTAGGRAPISLGGAGGERHTPEHERGLRPLPLRSPPLPLGDLPLSRLWGAITLHCLIHPVSIHGISASARKAGPCFSLDTPQALGPYPCWSPTPVGSAPLPPSILGCSL